MLTAGGVLGAGLAQSDDHSGDQVPVRVATGPGGAPVDSGAAAARLSDDALLKGAPWLDQSMGSPSIRSVRALPSLVFPAGTTYDDAITALYESVRSTGALPTSATLGPALPKDIVFAVSRDGSRLSLTAPYGYDVGTGNILMPSLAFPPSMSADDVDAALRDAAARGRAVPAGARVAGNALDACQMLRDGHRVATCETAGGAR
ncbi:MAG: hypothetical protein KDC33_08290 [Thermoleophilia bacterium]|nr:hypothetical protein [Thermoleophilia bacterium]